LRHDRATSQFDPKPSCGFAHTPYLLTKFVRPFAGTEAMATQPSHTGLRMDETPEHRSALREAGWSGGDWGDSQDVKSQIFVRNCCIWAT
jgi:hypothetical protein